MAVTLHRKPVSPHQKQSPKRVSLDNTLLYLVGAIGLIGSIYLVSTSSRTTAYTQQKIHTQSGMIVSQKQLITPVKEEVKLPESAADTVK